MFNGQDSWISEFNYWKQDVESILIISSSEWSLLAQDTGYPSCCHAPETDSSYGGPSGLVIIMIRLHSLEGLIRDYNLILLVQTRNHNHKLFSRRHSWWSLYMFTAWLAERASFGSTIHNDRIWPESSNAYLTGLFEAVCLEDQGKVLSRPLVSALTIQELRCSLMSSDALLNYFHQISMS